MKPSSGFTVVELLIVIAIIGVLASVILGSLNDAKDGGIDSKVTTEMVSFSKRAAVEESQTFSYDTVCGSNSATKSQGIIDITNSVETFSVGQVVCNSETLEYAASVQLRTGFWCVDSTGASKEVLANLNIGETVCP